MNKKQSLEEYRIRRSALYGLVEEHLQQLILRSQLPSERKGLGAVYALLVFLQGKRRFPNKNEVSVVISDILDTNLGKTEFVQKWELDLEDDLTVDNEISDLYELMEKLKLIRQMREGWGGWQDGI